MRTMARPYAILFAIALVVALLARIGLAAMDAAGWLAYDYISASGVPLLDGRVRRMINQGLLLVSDATSQAVADLVVGDTAPESFLEIGAGRATKTILDQSIAYRRYGKQIPEYVTVDVHAFKTKPVSYTHLTLPTICSV